MHAKVGGTTRSGEPDSAHNQIAPASAGKRSLVESLGDNGAPAAPSASGIVRAYGLSADAGGAASPAAAAIAGKGAGQSLAAPVADTAARAYGQSVSDVRVHNDSHAH